MKKTPSSKRTPLPRASDYAKSFLKDWERLVRSGRYDMKRLKETMLLLIANDAPLGPERECHIGGDFLLVYRVDDKGDTGIVFVRAGTHAELFNE